MPCYFLKPRIKSLLKELRFVKQREIEEELLKEKTDAELHEMSEDLLYALIMSICRKLLKKKMRKEATLIYI